MKKHILAALVAASLAACGGSSPEESVNKGNMALSKGELRSAGIEFKVALGENPNMASAREGLGDVFMAQRDFVGASTEYEKALASGVSEEKGLALKNKLARAFFSSESWLALKNIEPVSSEIQFYQARALMFAGDDIAIDSVSGDDGYSMLLKRIEILQKESPEAALKGFPVLASEDVQSQALLLKADIAYAAGKAEIMNESMAEYVELNPNDLRRKLQLSDILVRQNKLEKAAPYLDELIDKFPKNALVNQLYAGVQYDKGNYKKAQESAMIAIADSPNKIAPRLISAYSSMRLGNQDKAQTDLSFVVERLPKDHPAQRLYVSLTAENGDFEGSLDKVLAWESINAEDVPLLSSLGIEALRRGDAETARELAKKAGNAGTADPTLGMLQLSLNESETAFDTLETSFENNPESEVAKNTLASAYLAAERYEDALRLSDKWIDSGKAVEGLMLSGVVKSRQGAYPEALEDFTLVLKKEPGHFMARAGTLEVMVAQGELEGAKEKLKAWMKAGSGMEALFRNYLSAVRNKGGETAVADSANMLGEWISSGDISTDAAKLIHAQSQFLARDFNAVIGALREPSKEVKSSPLYWLLLSTANEQLGEFSKAAEVFSSWREMKPGNPMPLMGLVRNQLRLGMLDDAILSLKEAIPDLKDTGPAHLMLSQLYLRKGDMGNVRREFVRTPSELQSTQQGMGINGVLKIDAGNAKEGVALLRNVVQSTGDNDFLRWIVTGFQREGMSSERNEFLKEFVTQFPKNSLANFVLGNASVEDGNNTQAIEYYKTALAAAENALVLNNLAYVQMDMGQLDVAEKNAKRAVAMSPNTSSFVDTLANILAKKSRKEEAIKIMEDFLEKGNPVNDSFMETLNKIKD
jgi:putative PEP-CTERM system TPR-repeat lipoprotein